MLKKDLLVRQMEEFGKVLALLLSYKRNQEWEKFEKELAEALKSFTSLDLDSLEKMDPSSFEEKVVHSPALSLVQKKIVAGLLFERLEQVEKEKEKWEGLLKKCLVIYQFLADDLTENEFNLDIHYKLKLLKVMKEAGS